MFCSQMASLSARGAVRQEPLSYTAAVEVDWPPILRPANEVKKWPIHPQSPPKRQQHGSDPLMPSPSPSLHREIGPGRSTWHDLCMAGSILTPTGHPHRANMTCKNHALCVTLVTFQIQTHAFPPFPTHRHCEQGEAIQNGPGRKVGSRRGAEIAEKERKRNVSHKAKKP
jgi:predicted nucleic acid-binding Zn ribbon protein